MTPEDLRRKVLRMAIKNDTVALYLEKTASLATIMWDLFLMTCNMFMDFISN